MYISSLIIILSLYHFPVGIKGFSFFHKLSTQQKMSVNDATKVVRRSRAIPKEETKVYDLMEKYSNADGKGIKIAILDTGCDLRAAGLNGTTSDGVTPKYIDFLDCTGDGDILMDKSIDFDYTTNQTIKGLSGKSKTGCSTVI